MQSKPVFNFVFSDCIGGVASFNRNLINHTSLRNKCVIRVLLLRSAEDKRLPFNDILLADEVVRFSYSSMENQFSVLKRLYQNVGSESGCIVTDNGFVLNAMALFGKPKHVVYLIHDYFYINWAIQFANMIDAAIAHSSFFRDILLAASVREYQSKVFYIPYGVELPSSSWQKRSPGNILKLIFLGRIVEEKGVLLLKKIDDELKIKGIEVQWTIMGNGPLEETLKKQWSDQQHVRFMQAKDGDEVYRTLEEHDILVFPSQFEGTPVSIMEALSRGVVPVVSDLPGGTRDMVTNEVGFLCSTMNASEYADSIVLLHQNKGKLLSMQQACINKGREVYNINKASDAYFSFLLNQSTQPLTSKNGHVVQLSRLDSKLMPNTLVVAIRKARQKLGW